MTFILFKRALKVTEKKRLLMKDKEGELLTKDEPVEDLSISRMQMNLQFGNTIKAPY